MSGGTESVMTCNILQIQTKRELNIRTFDNLIKTMDRPDI